MDLTRYQPTLTPAQLTELLRLLGEIDEFKGHWRKLREIRAERLGELRHVTTIESAGSSTRIEGAELSNEEVARVLSGLSVDSFRARDASEVRGYGELLETIFSHFTDIPFEERYVKQLHGILLQYSERDAWHRGQYKKNDNHVEARHADGRVEVIFRTATPFDTPRLMTDLVEHTRLALLAREVHPLVVIAHFLVAFLAIHPFQDGNGRLSRALTSLLLLGVGYEYVPYASLESVIEENKGGYYVALRGSQLAMREAPADFSEWLLFFLRALRAQQRNLIAKLDIERTMVQLSDVQERILAIVDQHGHVTSSLVARTLQLPGRTVRYHLDVLIQHGLLEPIGEKRGRTYRRSIDEPSAVVAPDSRNAVILAEILEQGGRIKAAALRKLVVRHGSDARMVGTLHGRRLAHLRRDRQTGESVLTARGREIAEQHLFTRRLARLPSRDAPATG